MDLIQLKMPPDEVRRMANAIERDMEVNPSFQETEKLRKTLVWLRYRLSLWDTKHPAPAKP